MQIVQKRHLFLILLFLGVGNSVQGAYRGISKGFGVRPARPILGQSIRAKQLKFTIPQFSELFNRIPQNQQSQKIVVPGYNAPVSLSQVAADASIKLNLMDAEILMVVLDGFESKMIEYKDDPQQFLLWVQTKLAWWNSLPEEEQARLKTELTEREAATEAIAESAEVVSEQFTTPESGARPKIIWGSQRRPTTGVAAGFSQLGRPTLPTTVASKEEFMPQLGSRIEEIRIKALQQKQPASQIVPEAISKKEEEIAESAAPGVEPIPLWISVRIDDPQLKKRISGVARRMTKNLTDSMVGKQPGRMEKADIDAFKRMLSSVENQGYHLVLADASIMPSSMPKSENVKVWKLTDQIVLMGIRKSSAEKLEYAQPGALTFMEPRGTLISGEPIPTVVTVLVGSQFPLTTGVYTLQGLPGISFSVRRTDADTLNRFSTALATIIEPAKIESQKLALEAPQKPAVVEQEPEVLVVSPEPVQEIVRPMPKELSALPGIKPVLALPAPPKRPAIVAPEKVPALPGVEKLPALSAPLPQIPIPVVPELSASTESTVLVPKPVVTADLVTASQALLPSGIDLSRMTEPLVASAVAQKPLSSEVADQFLNMLASFNQNGFLAVLIDPTLFEGDAQKPLLVYQDAHAGILALPQKGDLADSFAIDFPEAGSVILNPKKDVPQQIVPVLVGSRSGIRNGIYQLSMAGKRTITFSVQQTTPQTVALFFDALKSSTGQIGQQERITGEGVLQASTVLPAPKQIPALPALPKRPAIAGPEKLPALPAPTPERSRMNEVEQQLARTNSRLAELQTQLDAAKELVATTDTKNISLQESIIKLTNERDELQKKVEKITAEQREQSGTQRSQAEAEIAATKKAAEDAIAAEKEKAQELINKQRAEAEQAMDQLRSEADQSVRKAETEAEKVRAEIASMRSEIEQARAAQSAVQQGADLAEQKVANLQSQLTAVQSELKKSSGENKANAAEVERLQAALRQAQNEAEAARQKEEALQSDYQAKLREAVETARARQKQQDQQEVEKQKEDAIRAARLAEIQKEQELKKLNEANEQLQDRIQQDQQELQRLRVELITAQTKPGVASKEVQATPQTAETAAQVKPVTGETATEPVPKQTVESGAGTEPVQSTATEIQTEPMPVRPTTAETGISTQPQETPAPGTSKVSVQEYGSKTTALTVVPEQPEITYSRWQQFTNWFKEKFISSPKEPKPEEPKPEKKK